jgi:hypothetical protein
LDRGWSTGRPGLVFELLRRHRIANPCFILDELDKQWLATTREILSSKASLRDRLTDLLAHVFASFTTDATVTNPDGSAKSFTGGGFDVRVLDDGLNYKLWIDGVLYASDSYSRPTGNTSFRWGMYFGAGKLNAPADFNIILVSGAQVKSWPGILTTATTAITKANNTTNLNSGGSWTGGVSPGLNNQALWDNTVAAANTTTLASYQQWAGLKITNPGGMVTINGSAILGLDESGVDLSAATQNLTVNCPVQLTAPSTWGVASGRTATFNGTISGFPGLTLNGGGTTSISVTSFTDL